MAHSNALQPTASALDSLLSQSTAGMPSSSMPCCCGRPNCAYLKHNDAALRGLEQELQSAAQIGQVSIHDYTLSSGEAGLDALTFGSLVRKRNDADVCASGTLGPA